jgi:hypothetical protein
MSNKFVLMMHNRHKPSDLMEAVCFFGTSASTYKSTWRHNPEQHRQKVIIIANGFLDFVHRVAVCKEHVLQTESVKRPQVKSWEIPTVRFLREEDG